MSWLSRLRVSPPVNRLRYHAYRDVLLKFPRVRTCNLCGWRGRRLLSYQHKYVQCPQCGSKVRHRLIAAALDRCGHVRDHVRLDGGSVLHVSADYCLGLFLRPRAAEYIRADDSTSGCDIRVDLTSMPEIPDGRFDIVMLCDVLEHIDDDTAAIREIHRALRPGGTAILTVPQFDHDEPTLEDPSIVSREDRVRLYGQEDHVRNYGKDFGAKLEAAGFRVTVVEAADFDDEYVACHVLKPPVPLEGTFGWNNRRIYFATA